MVRIIRKQTEDGTSWFIHQADWAKYRKTLNARAEDIPEHNEVFMSTETHEIWDALTGSLDFGRRQVPILFDLRPGEYEIC